MLVPRFKIKVEVLPNQSIDHFKTVIAEGGTYPWSKLDGLRNKYFTFFGQNQGAGFYTWKTKDAMEKYMKTVLWEGMSQQPHLTELTYKIYEVLEASACCFDLGTWPRADPPT
jgi:hypothetical protein